MSEQLAVEQPGCAVFLATHAACYQALRSHIQRCQEIVYNGSVYERGSFRGRAGRSWSVGLVQLEGGSGAEAAAEIERATACFAPDVVLMVGLASGLAEEIAPGDVVIATRVYGYEAGRTEAGTFLTRPDVGEVSYSLLQRARALARNRDWQRRIRDRAEAGTAPQVWLGPLASGSRVVTSEGAAIVDFLRRHYNGTLALDLEGRGFLAGAWRSESVRALLVAGIATRLPKPTQLETTSSLARAAKHAAAFACALLAKLEPALAAVQPPGPPAFRDLGVPPPLSDQRAIQARPEAVEAIYAYLLRPDISALVLSGLGGVGKSTLATQVYAEELSRSQGRFEAEPLWLGLEGATLIDLAGSLALHLGLDAPAYDFARQAPSQQAAFLAQLLDASEPGRLVILDQFESLLDPQTGRPLAGYQALAVWLETLNSRAFRCKVVLTSRLWPRGANAPAWMQEYHVMGLTASEGRDLLRLQGVTLEQARDDELDEAVRSCSGHAYALTLLAAILRTNRGLKLRSLLHEPLYAQLWHADVASELLNYIYEQQLAEDQRELLRVFALYRQPVSLEVALATLEQGVLASPLATLRVLLGQHLLLNMPGGSYQPHALVTTYMRARAFPPGTTEQQHAQAAAYYLSLVHPLNEPTPTFDRVQERRRLANLLEAAWHLSQAGRQREAYALIEREELFGALLRQGAGPALRDFYQSLLPLERWQPEPELAARITNELGEIAHLLGEKQAARAYFEQALALFQAQGDRVHEGHAWNNLGLVARLLGQYAEARRAYQRALTCFVEVADVEGEGRVWNNLGLVHLGQEEPEEARACYERALSLHRESGNLDEEARTLNNLGEWYSHQEPEYARARAYLEQAQAIFQDLGSRREEGTVLNNLALIAHAEGNHAEAGQWYEAAIRLYQGVGDRWQQSRIMDNLGLLQRESGRLEEARDCYAQALALQQALGDRAGELLTCLHQGELAIALGTPDAAQQAYGQALRLAWELGDRSVEIEVLNAFGWLCQQQQRYAQALACLLQARSLVPETRRSMLKILQALGREIERALGPQAFVELEASIEPHAALLVRQLLRVDPN